MSNRVTKFRLPERTPRPSDDAYFDHVLGEVEREQSASAEETKIDFASDVTAAPGADGAASSETAPMRSAGNLQAEPTSDENTSPNADPSAEATQPVPPRRINALRAKTIRRSNSKPEMPPLSSLPYVEPSNFVEFRKRWSPLLTDTHLNLCGEIFQNTVAAGHDHYETTVNRLGQAVGKSRRHTFLLLQQLEKIGFVTREEIKDNNCPIGIRLWFHITPLQK